MASRAAGGKDSTERAVDAEVVNSEAKSGQDEKSQKWQRGDEVRAKKASIAQHGTIKRGVELNPEEQLEVRKLNREKITGRPLQQVALFILLKMNLVPEHVETRTLLTEIGGNAPCGELRMFVDIFPMDYGLVPPPIVIRPRDPENYQLRIALFNVCGAIPVKRSFGIPTSDLYVKVYINGSQKAQKSDVHFRSTDGCGEFNWRFVINVAYNPWERKIINYSKKRLFKKASESMMDPLVIIQLWDKNKFRKDEMLGQMVMDITHFKEGIDDPEDVGIIRKRKPASERCRLCSRKCCCVRVCIFCKDTRCGCKARRTVKMPFPKPMKYKIPKEDVVDTINLFDSDSIRGWWPVLTEKPPHRQDKDAEKKKDDDVEEEQMYIMGLLELEMALVTEAEAKADPVGKKRKEPNHSPYLPKPLRSSWNMFFITSRIRPCCCWAWHKCGIQLFCWIVAILLLAVAAYGLFVNWPVVTTMLIT